MTAIQKNSTVAVTGAAGFIGGWVVRTLLDKGYRVRACVRDENDAQRTGFLRAMPGFASGRLTLHSADLDRAGCFDEIFSGCQGVAHISHVSDYGDHDYIRSVCAHIIDSIDRADSISRVVVTSSVAAVISEMDLNEIVKRPVFDENRYPDDSNPKRTAASQGYSMGKVIAESVFAEAAAASGRWDAVTCCPGDNVGPILSPHHKERGPWQHHIENMLLGEYEQTWAYRPWYPVDVRDDAAAHVGLLESATVANGERYIAWSTDAIDVADVCASIDRVLPELRLEVSAPVEVHPEKIRAREQEFRACWAHGELHNERIRAATGVSFRPFDDSLRDCVESLLAVAKVIPVQRRAKG